ncbi:MAG: TonB-dependent receptor plug domain-containing protein [Saprospiraceae bacterium]
MKTIYFILLSLSFSYLAAAQQDSAALQMKRLGIEAIQYEEQDSLIPMVISTTRSPLALSQSPFETYIITQEEIFQYGCNTLIDVLRLIPGLMCSKIGSAIEGELFTVNAMNGNSNFQILINDAPLRSFSTKGMSLGAQLPIKQAERIEIQLGSATAAYGYQAGGGVINIILKQSERPVYTSAELNFGKNNYNNIDVNFGGKLGKGKHIGRFNIYGGYTLLNNRPVNGDSSNYLPQTYNPSKSYLKHPNGNDWNNLEEAFSIGNYALPHFSRYAGFHFNYRAFFISYDQLSRKDHSSMGLNPSVLRYKDESSFFQDYINTVSIGCNLSSKNYNFRMSSGWMRYKTNEASSAFYYAPQAGIFLDSILVSKIPASSRLLYAKSREKLSERQKYFSGTETNIPFQISFDRKFAKNFHFGLSSIDQVVFYQPQFYYGQSLKSRAKDTLDFGFIEGNKFSLAGSIMGKLYYQSPETFALVDFSSGFVTQGNDLNITTYRNLRLGLQQKIKFRGTNYMLKTNFNRSQLPINQYLLDNEIYTYTALNNNSSWSQKFERRNFNPNAQPQQLQEFQVAIQKFKYYAQTQLQYQYRSINRLAIYKPFVAYDKLPADAPNVDAVAIRAFTNGFDFSSTDQTTFHQIKFSTVFNLDGINHINNLWRRGIFNFRYAFTYQWGSENISNKKYAYVRILPKRVSQLSMYFNPFTKLSLGMTWNYYSQFYTALAYMQVNPQATAASHQIDLIVDYSLNDNLKLKVKINNAFDRNIFGINATETPDDLQFNMQQGRFTQIGIAYNLDYKPKKKEKKKAQKNLEQQLSNDFNLEFGN